MNEMPTIIMKVVEHREQRYPTVGDWQFTDDKSVLTIYVSRLGDWRSEFAVSVHEAFEALACEEAGITDEAVTAFDRRFEREREQGLHGPEEEPGDDQEAPYREQHLAATELESAVCEGLGLDWLEHETTVNAVE